MDRKNPDPSLRTRPLLDLKMVEGLEYVGDGQWKNGTIYTADTGKSYRFQAKLRPGGVLEVRGYAGLTPFGRTAVWTRVE